jgi:hypothetical protein
MINLFKASQLCEGMAILSGNGERIYVESTGSEPDWIDGKMIITGWKRVQFSDGYVYTFVPDANYDFYQWNVIHVPLSIEEKQRLIEAAE